MKVAIIGSQNKAQILADDLNRLGANVVWFKGENQFSFQEDHILEIRTYPHRIHKRFLSQNEKINNRMSDLFRCVYYFNPKTMGNNFLDSNLKIDPNLAEIFEACQDVDYVICTEPNLTNDLSCGMGVSGFLTLSEKSILEKNVNRIFYDAQAFDPDLEKLDESNYIAIIGSNKNALRKLDSLKKWICDDDSRVVFVITSSEYPFSHLDQTESEILREFQYFIDQRFEARIQEFLSEKKKWDELDDFIKRKVKLPSEPIYPIQYFSGHNVSSINQLEESNKLYLTCELAPFRKVIKQPENGAVHLKTISVNLVFVFKDNMPYDISSEVGYLNFLNQDEDLEQEKEQLKQFINTYFNVSK